MTHSPLLTEIVRDERFGAYAILRLNRPGKKNALSMELRDALETTFNRIAGDDEVKAIILTGCDSCFCAGFDLKEALETDLESFDHRFREFFDALFTFPKPLVTAINGFAFAGGFDLALAGDIIIADEGAQFGHLEVRFGVNALMTPLWGRVGVSKAFELALLGEPVSAKEAHSIGLINYLVPSATFWEKTITIAETIVKKPLTTLLLMKEMKRKIRLMDYETAIYHEINHFRKLSHNKGIYDRLSDYVRTMGKENL